MLPEEEVHARVPSLTAPGYVTAASEVFNHLEWDFMEDDNHIYRGFWITTTC